MREVKAREDFCLVLAFRLRSAEYFKQPAARLQELEEQLSNAVARRDDARKRLAEAPEGHGAGQMDSCGQESI